MKQSPLTTVLLAALAISTLACVGLCWKYISNTRELNMAQREMAVVNNSRAVINALASDALEYSKKNPAIDPILEAAGVKGNRANAAAPAASSSPAVKPATK